MDRQPEYDDERDELERTDDREDSHAPEERVYAAMLGYRCEDE